MAFDISFEYLCDKFCCEIDARENVRKDDVDEECKESHLQGLKDQLVAVDSSQTEEIQLELKKGDLAEKSKNQFLLGGSKVSIA